MRRAAAVAALVLAVVALMSATARAAPAPTAVRAQGETSLSAGTIPSPSVRARRKRRRKRRKKKKTRSKKRRSRRRRKKRSKKKRSKKKPPKKRRLKSPTKRRPKTPAKKRAKPRTKTPRRTPLCSRARLQLQPFTSRIAGGLPHSTPSSYHAALFSGVRRCTGALIAPGWVLSAAHCALLPGDRILVGGPSATRGSVRLARAIVRHPSFMRDRTKVANDVMLVRLDRPAAGAHVRLNGARASPAAGTLVRASGYGRQATEGARGPLRFADLDVVSGKGCARRFARKGLNLLARGVTDAVHICANHDECDAGPCFGDSGGPLVARDRGGRPVLVGVASYGTAECGSRHTPDVYARISTYRGWIERVTRGEAEFVALE